MDEPDDLLATAASAVAALAARPPYALSNDDLRSALDRLHRITTIVAGTAATLVHEASARGLPHRDAATSTVAWLRDLLRISAADANRMITLGQLMDRRSVIAAALESAALNPAQALAIGRTLDDVPADDPNTVDKVEATLIDHATQFEPSILRRLGERVLAHVNPSLADARLRDQLERAERNARNRRGLTLSADGLGGTRVSGTLDTEARRSSPPRSNPSRDRFGATMAPINAAPQPDAPTPSSMYAGSHWPPAAFQTTVDFRPS